MLYFHSVDEKKNSLKNVWCGKLAAFISEVTINFHVLEKTLKRHDQMFSFGEI
jgi:hypothetical protein